MASDSKPPYRRLHPVEVGPGDRVRPAKPKQGCRIPDRIAGRVERLVRETGQVSDQLSIFWDRELALMGDEADDRVRLARQQALVLQQEAVRLRELLNG